MIKINGKNILISLMLSTIMIAISSAGTNGVNSVDATKLPCSDCHLCQTPTIEEPCLKGCLFTHTKGIKTSSNISGPSKIMMGKPTGEFGLVPFDHKAHAEMEEMGGGCNSCHHYNASHKIQPCGDCHTKPMNFGQPGLKGIYHRQCLGCHQEWSHTNECSKCHIKSIEASNMSVSTAVWTENSSQSLMTLPTKRVYSVVNSPGVKVTFYHDEHSGKFGLNCNDCHKNEECGNCHDQTQSITEKKTESEVHAICIDCHLKDNCDKCHGNEEKLRFSHDEQHWRLGAYHKELECSACHLTGKRISKLKADCNSCHSEWNSEEFDHTVTGFELDDMHSELDCEDCHKNRRFHDVPSCTECHEDGRTVINNPPGLRRELTVIQAQNETGK